MDDPPGSRLFVVCGKSAEEEVLKCAFDRFGSVTNVKVIRDKGVAYVKFDKASCAAAAMEELNGAVLNNGRGPKLKVLLAESPNSRSIPPTRYQVELEVACDPDNLPPRSRLFLVVPKTADGEKIKAEMNMYSDMEYCKIDLIQSKGVVFCKYAKASSALKAMEGVNETSTLCGYRVKCMLAEPKHKRPRADGLIPAFVPPIHTPIDFADGMANSFITSPHRMTPLPAFSAISRLSSPGLLNSMSGMNMAAAAGLSAPLSKMVGSPMMSPLGTGSMLGTPSSIRIGSGAFSPMSPNSPMCGINFDQSAFAPGGDLSPYPVIDNSPSGNDSPIILSRLRLFVVVYKGVSEEKLAGLFRRFPGMEYCDLKKDKRTNKSKGYCYVNYSTHESAAAAVQYFNGIEFPPHSGHRLKVMFAEPLGVRPPSTLNHNGSMGSAYDASIENCPELEDNLIDESTSPNSGTFTLKDDNLGDTQVHKQVATLMRM